MPSWTLPIADPSTNVAVPTWTAEQRFTRIYERLALPGLHRRARYDLLVMLGALGRYPLRGVKDVAIVRVLNPRPGEIGPVRNAMRAFAPAA